MNTIFLNSMNLCACLSFVLVATCSVLNSRALLAQTTIQTTQQSDSLQKVILSAHLHDSVRIDAMNELAEYYGRVRSNYDSCALWAKEAEKQAINIQYAHGDAIAKSILGATFLFRSQVASAQKYFFQALKIAEEHKDHYCIAYTCNLFGLLASGQGNYAGAREYFERTLSESNMIGDKKSTAFAMGNIVQIYLLEGNYDAIINSDLSSKFKDAAYSLGDYAVIANYLYLMGAAYLGKKQIYLAEKYSSEAVIATEKVGAFREKSGSLAVLARVYFEKRNFGKAYSVALQALTIADSLQASGSLQAEGAGALETLSLSLDSLGQYKQSLYFYKRFTALKDSLQSADIALKTNLMKEQYQQEQRARSMQAEETRRKLLQNVFLICFGVVFCVALVLGVLYRQKQRANQEILRQQSILENQANEIELANTTLQEKNVEIEEAHKQSESLLLNILPAPIAQRLKSGERAIADRFDSVTVLFADIVGFTKLSARTSPEELVQGLNGIFERFDALATKYNLEKIKTIGDAYMVAGGLPERSEDHCERVAMFALEIQAAMREESLQTSTGEKVALRIGLHTGEAVAGVIGTSKFSYDLWGDTVNTASRMESHGEAGKIHCSEEVYDVLKEKFVFEERGEIEVMGKGRMRTWFLVG